MIDLFKRIFSSSSSGKYVPVNQKDLEEMLSKEYKKLSELNVLIRKCEDKHERSKLAKKVYKIKKKIKELNEKTIV